MKIWLINPYGPIPSEAWRKYCFPLIAETLTSEGHDVVWWTSSFAHHFKKWRSTGWEDVVVSDNFLIRLVPTPGYKKNIGIGRIIRDAVFAMRTYFRGCKEQRPDIIVFSESPLTFGYAGSKLAKFHGCAAIYHQMDLWPELIVNSFNPLLRKIINSMLKPVYVSRKNMFSDLSAATALAAPYLEAILKEAPQLRGRPNAVIYNGIDVKAYRSLMSRSHDWPKTFPIKAPTDFWAVFAGSLGPSYDIDTICEAARILRCENSRISIVVAGDGPKRERLAAAAENRETYNLHYFGQLSVDSLVRLYAKCDLGLCAYSAASNVEMPDKIYDYTAACLPVLVSLKGEVAEIVKSNKCGLQYEAGSAIDLVNKINIIAGDRNLLMSMSAASRALGSKFDSKSQYAKILPIVREVTSAK